MNIGWWMDWCYSVVVLDSVNSMESSVALKRQISFLSDILIPLHRYSIHVKPHEGLTHYTGMDIVHFGQSQIATRHNFNSTSRAKVIVAFIKLNKISGSR